MITIESETERAYEESHEALVSIAAGLSVAIQEVLEQHGAEYIEDLPDGDLKKFFIRGSDLSIESVKYLYSEGDDEEE